MKLKDIFAKRMTVAEGLRVPVSRHFFYSTFAVRGRYDSGAHMGGFVCEGTPGTGFFVRNTESHSYRRFVTAAKKRTQQNLWTLITGKEPDFDKEYKRVEEAFANVTDSNVKQILSSYQNVISLAKDEEQLQRIVRAVKDKMGNHPNKSMVSVISHYKSSIAGLERDVRSAQMNYSKKIGEEQLAAWSKVVDAFHLLVESRRLWAVYLDNGTPAYQQVFFDMGIFDYIQSPGDTPVMRDYDDTHYYLYPDGMVAARSSVDFDFYKWKDIDFEFKVVDISTLAVRPQFNSHSHKSKSKHKHSSASTDALSTLYGMTRAQVVGEIYIPKIDRRFFVNHTGPAEDFYKAVKEYKKIVK
ncbi:MAG: hypothetical protein J6T88_09910 [Bacteroidales bacterium]|nr:hypothetical protein [Bacteroidales bacterium]